MKRFISMTCSAVALTYAMAQPAVAQRASCPGGEAKTASGACVNPGLSASLRLRGTLLSQPKISVTAFPVPPTADRVYPRQTEYNRLELTQGVFSTNPSPFSCHPNCGTVIRTTPVTTPVVTTPVTGITAR